MRFFSDAGGGFKSRCYLKSGHKLVFDINGGAEGVIGGPLLGHGEAIVLALVLGLQVTGNLVKIDIVIDKIDR